MKDQMKLCIAILFAVSTLTLVVSAQAGDGFDLTHSVIASGGASSAGSTTFRVEGTVGQNVAGTTSTGINGAGTQFRLRGGFWAFERVAPTAATVSVGGRVLSAAGLPLNKVGVFLTGSDGVMRVELSNPFGYYRFDGIEVGQTYVIMARAKGYQFVPQTVAVYDELTDLDLISLW